MADPGSGGSSSFLSAQWFEAASELLVGAGEPLPGLSSRVQWQASGAGTELRWASVIEDGRLVEFRLGSLTSPDVELLTTVQHAWRTWTRSVDAHQAMGGVTVVEDETGSSSNPVAPMDLSVRPELEALPLVPGADLSVQYRYGNAPFGPVPFAICFTDGRVGEMKVGHVADPDVEVSSTFLQMALVRRGDMSILDALAGGAQVTGSEGALALLGGISESPEFRRAELACGPSGLALGVLGELSAQPAYEAARSGLAEQTSEPT